MEKNDLLKHVFFKTNYGSTLYGTNGPNSDLDIKYFFLPPLKDLLIGKSVLKTKFISEHKEDKSKQVDEDFISIQKFAFDFLKGVPYAIEIAYSFDLNNHLDHQSFRSFKHQFLIFVDTMKSFFLNRNLSGFLGYVNQINLTFNKQSIVEDSSLPKEAYKNAYHCVRVARSATELLSEKTLTIPYDLEFIELLKSIKECKLSRKEVVHHINFYTNKMEKALEESDLQYLTSELEIQFDCFVASHLKDFYDINMEEDFYANV
jgi:predicted nucleotidyltransferase